MAAARALASSAPLGFSGLALRRQDAPLPMRLSECETRGGGAEQEQEEGRRRRRGGGGGRDGAGCAAQSPAPIGGRAAARGLSLVRRALL